jgi:hypothetical protein
MKVKLKA